MTDEFDWTGFEHTRDACVPPKRPSDDDEDGNGALRAPADQQHVWLDSGSGPGYGAVAPKPRLRPDRDKLS